MNIKPLHEYVLIRPENPAESEGGIFIPEAYRDDPANRRDFIRESNRFCPGVVVAVGMGRKVLTKRDRRRFWEGRREVPDLEVGAKVFYKRAEAVDVPGDEGLVMVRDESIAFERAP